MGATGFLSRLRPAHMIRRDEDSDWLLISQVEHARIAAELAEAWVDQELRRFSRRNELLSAILHHDDGWTAWERAPTINQIGEPRDFTEMPMTVATSIWARSIDACTTCLESQHSSYGGLWVSRHFCFLAEAARDSRHSETDLVAIDDFLLLQNSMQHHWRQQIVASDEAVRTSEQLGFRWLQAFDRISLWLCCARRRENWRLQLPSGAETEFIPQPDQAIVVDPFPFPAPITLEVDPIRVPHQLLQHDEQLRKAICQAPRQHLGWRLVPATPH